MRVVVFSGFFLPHLGGVENYIWEVYRRLPDVKAIIVTCNTEGAPTREQQQNLTIIRLPAWNLVGRSFPVPKPTFETFRLLRSLWAEDFDVVNTHVRFFLTTLLGLLLAKTKGIPLLHTEHGSDHVRHVSKIVEIVARVYDYTFGKLVFLLADRVIGASRTCKTFAENMGTRSPVGFVSNGVDIQFFQRRPTNLKKSLGLPQDSPIITYVGRLMGAKGPALLIKAFERLERPADLLVVGGGPMEKALKKLADNNRRIHLVGPKEKRTIPEFLSITDIFVLPTTTHPEGLPTAVLEAGACGCAVIATDVGGSREIIQDGQTGLLIRPQEQALTAALQKLLESPALREQMASALNSKVVHDFNWTKLSPQFYRQLTKTYGQKVRSS